MKSSVLSPVCDNLLFQYLDIFNNKLYCGIDPSIEIVNPRGDNTTVNKLNWIELITLTYHFHKCIQ